MSSAAQNPDSNPPFVHPTAIIEDRCTLGAGVKVWHHSQLRTGCQIGEGVSIGKSCFIDSEVSIGPHSRIQNGVSVYAGVDICSWVFIGPNVTFTNDLLPRAGRIKWTRVATHIENGASIGAGAVIILWRPHWYFLDDRCGQYRHERCQTLYAKLRIPRTTAAEYLRLRRQ